MGVRLAVTTEFIKPGRVGGAEQMAHALIEGLREAMAPDDELLVFGGSSTSNDSRAAFSSGSRLRLNRFIREAATFRRYANSVDGWLFPNYHTPGAKRRCRVVTVIHDLQYLHYPTNFSLQKRVWLSYALRATLRRADRVVVPSNFVREDLLRGFGRAFGEQVRVIPNPVSWESLDQKRGTSAGGPYILTVAAHYAHKNLATLIRAFAQVHAQRPDVKLVMVGQVPRNLVGVRAPRDLTGVVRECGLESSVLMTGYVSRAELGAWYREAQMFVLPSLFEGFGIPAVEALGCGLPVVTTRCGSLPEVTQNQAVYVDNPTDPMCLARSILRVLRDPARYRPSVPCQQHIRLEYSPARIGRAYYAALTDD